MTNHRSRRWFQLSLKSLFLLTLVVAAFFAGYSLATRQSDAVLDTERGARKKLERANLELARALIKAEIFRDLDEAARRGAQIVCFPETQTVGYRVDIATPELPVPVAKLDALHERVARRCGELGMACILGTEVPTAPDQKPYNSALVIAETGRVLGTHHKTKLTPLDAIAYTPGTSIETFEHFGVTVGVVICFEGFRFPETTRECVRQGARLVFHPQNNTTRPNDWKIPIHHAMITTRAAENTIWFASCNACLDHQNCRSLVIAPDGLVHAMSKLHREEVLIADLDIDRATRAMFRYDLDGCAELLFADTVAREEYASALK